LNIMTKKASFDSRHQFNEYHLQHIHKFLCFEYLHLVVHNVIILILLTNTHPWYTLILLSSLIQNAIEQPSLVIVYFGGNDCIHPFPSGLGPHVPLEEYVENMRKIAIHIMVKEYCYFDFKFRHKFTLTRLKLVVNYVHLIIVFHTSWNSCVIWV